ncbi:L-rhamnose mutarotase [Streptomyces sp. CLV115]|uniref:L-rhamnose mutarotase n=1 Tax=Streptomyces sp. CLV115 TaxID=3138502 RepID=UPI00406C638A
MQRVCFPPTVRRDRIDEYRERRAAVRPDMLAALRAAGRHNHSLLPREDGDVPLTEVFHLA